MTNEMMRPRAFVLETRRLLLRSLADEDVDAVHRLYADWDVAKSLSRITHPFSLEAARQFVGEAQEALVQGSSYVLGMFERRNGALVGVVSLRIPSMDPARREEERADDARLGILGYAVARPSWGQGFASEGAKRMVRFAFDDLRLDRLQASPLRDNPASGRVLKGLGFTVAEAGISEEPVYGGPPRLADRYLLREGARLNDPLPSFDRLVDPERNAAERLTNQFEPFRRVETRHEDPAANNRAMMIVPILLGL